MALYELKCPSLDYVYRMSWAEFRIRLFAYKRAKKKELFQLRELSWIVYNAPHLDVKKLKKNKEAFWPLEGKKPVTDAMLQRMKEVQLKYLKQKESE